MVKKTWRLLRYNLTIDLSSSWEVYDLTYSLYSLLSLIGWQLLLLLLRVLEPQLKWFVYRYSKGLFGEAI